MKGYTLVLLVLVGFVAANETKKDEKVNTKLFGGPGLGSSVTGVLSQIHSGLNSGLGRPGSTGGRPINFGKPGFGGVQTPHNSRPFGQGSRPGGFGQQSFGHGSRPGGFGQQSFGHGSRPGNFGQQSFGHGSRPGNFGQQSFGQGSSSGCRHWCKTPEGAAYCCQSGNERHDPLIVKPGQCPPVRPQCPPTRSGPPNQCSNDGGCKGIDKCCFDRCLEHHVCKPPLHTPGFGSGVHGGAHGGVHGGFGGSSGGFGGSSGGFGHQHGSNFNVGGFARKKP